MLGASSRRRLQPAGSSRHGSRRPQASRPANNEADLELPAYEEPRLPLTVDQQRALRELASGRINASLQKHADASAKLLAGSAFAINERATNRKEALERAVKRRRVNNDDGEAGDEAEIESVRAKAEELKSVVDPLTLKVEKAMRNILDMQAALQDEKELMKDLPAVIAMAQEDKVAQAQEDAPAGEDDEQPEVSGISIYHVIEQDREAKLHAYNELSVFQKYAKNNSYIDFKRNWHDGLFRDDEIPVPDPKTWFDRNGQPQHVARADGGVEDDSDADIQISKEVRSFRCPLSLVALTEPYTCRRCKHTFQKDAIFAYLGITAVDSAGLEMKCPETGCNLQDMRQDDLYLDESLLRRIKRAEQVEREEESSDREEAEEQGDDTVEASVKPEDEEDDEDVVDEDED